MGFKNPYREQLKEDEARCHFECHVLPDSPMHVQQRREAALKKYVDGADHLDFNGQEMLRRQLEEELFQEWYDGLKARGLAQFGDPFCVDDDYE